MVEEKEEEYGMPVFHMITVVILSDEGPINLENGTIVGQGWTIMKKLGEGGCGSVYLVSLRGIL